MGKSASEAKTRCAACGLAGHRYGRNEGMERFDPMACINQLLGALDREVNFKAAYEYGDRHGISPEDVVGLIAAARESTDG